MKVLQVFDFFSLPHGSGTVDIIYRLSKELAKRGHEVTVCTGDFESDHGYRKSNNEVKFIVHHSKYNRHGMYFMPDLFKFDVTKYDIIHFHCYRSFQNAVLGEKARRHGVPYVVDTHGSTADRNGKAVIRKAYDLAFGRRMLEYANRMVAETSVGVGELVRLGADKRRIVELHPLIDTSEFKNLPLRGEFREAHLIGNLPMVLYLGRIHSDKGIAQLLQTIRLLRDRNGNRIMLVAAGQEDGTQIGDYSGMTHVGFLSGRDKLTALVDADVLVQPSLYEAGARPPLEAILCGTPVVVSRGTGSGEKIASFDGGMVVDCTNPNRIAWAIQHTLSFPEEAKERTLRAREYVLENLSLSRNIHKYENLYEEAMKWQWW